MGRAHLALSSEARELVVAAPWRGNVRELANVLERAAILAGGGEIEAEHLELADGAAPVLAGGNGGKLDDIERAAIEQALAAVGGNRRAAADRLGIGLRTLYDKLKKYRGDGGEE